MQFKLKKYAFLKIIDLIFGNTNLKLKLVNLKQFFSLIQIKLNSLYISNKNCFFRKQILISWLDEIFVHEEFFLFDD